MINVSYVLPITAYDTSVAVAYRRSDFNVVSDPFRALGIEGHTEIFSVTLQQPVYRTLNQVVNLGVQGEYLHNRNLLLGQPFDFFAGYQNGVANVAALRFLQDWTYRTQDSMVGVRSRFSVGLDVLDATANSGPVADTRYFSWVGQLQGLHRFDQYAGTQLLGRLDVQLTNDRLFPLEQMPIGGRYSVRGYRENSLLRDNALLFSIEPRLPLSHFKAVLGTEQGEVLTWKTPVGISLDRANRLYVVEMLPNRVRVYDVLGDRPIEKKYMQ